MDNNQPINNLNMNSEMNPTPSSQPTSDQKHKGHGGLIAAIVIVVVAAIAAVMLIGNGDAPAYQSPLEENISDSDTVILDENASDDLGSIEADLESLDIENLDSGLE